MSNVLLDQIFSKPVSSLLIFTIVFHIRMHLTPEPNKFHNRHTGYFCYPLSQKMDSPLDNHYCQTGFYPPIVLCKYPLSLSHNKGYLYL